MQSYRHRTPSSAATSSAKGDGGDDASGTSTVASVDGMVTFADSNASRDVTSAADSDANIWSGFGHRSPLCRDPEVQLSVTVSHADSLSANLGT